jgi:hypothetical protein
MFVACVVPSISKLRGGPIGARRTSMLSTAIHITTDLDDFRAKLRPIDAEIIATARGRFTAIITRVDFDRLWTQRTQESLPRLIHASTSPKRAGFAFLTHPGPGIIWNGTETRSSDIISAPSGRDFCYRLSGSPQWEGSLCPRKIWLKSASL